MSVSDDGKPRDLADGTRLRINPFREQDKQAIRYTGGCNISGSSLRITADRLLLADDSAGTDMGCGEERQAQDDWFSDFLHTDPAWSLSEDGTELTLTGGDTVIVLEESDWPPYT